MKKFYALAIGGKRGIYNTWKECEKNIGKGFSKYKSFDNIEEATEFLNANPSKKSKNKVIASKKNLSQKFSSESKQLKELEKVKSINVVYVPKSNIDKKLLAEKAKKSFEASKAKQEEKERIRQRDLEILRNRNLKK